MGLSILHLIESVILFINAFAILNAERFLTRMKWHDPAFADSYGEATPLQKQITFFLYAARTYGRVPLIFINVFVIAIELLVG
jgi:hypothetical protein